MPLNNQNKVASMQPSDKAYPDSFPLARGNPDPVAGSIAHLLHLLDRPIAFHRCFVDITGSVTAALMLSQAIYWQKRTKDHDGWWYKTRDEWTEETGLSRYEQEGARKRLRKLGLMQERLRGVPATIWYRVNEERLLEGLSKVAQRETSNPVPVGGKPAVQLVENQPTGRRKNHQLVGGKPPNKSAGFAPTFNEQRLHRDYTETTTTTPNPSSSTERAAEPEAARGGGGVKNRTPKDRDGDHGTAALEASGENPASGEEVQAVATADERGDALTEAPAELVYPAKLTEREREDIAAQVHALPREVAQQMLDVIEAKRQAGQIKTNPAAVLRGIVRKYRADPAAFDPSPGFGNAEARRRRAEAETRLRAASEVRDPVPATLPLPARQSGSRPRPAGLEAMLRATRQVLHMTG